MATWDQLPHWITEACDEARQGYSRHRRQVCCDKCAEDGLYPPNQLHETLYCIEDGVYLCEFHMIMAGSRPPTPEFIRAFRKAQEAQHNQPPSTWVPNAMLV
mgnify:FL=1